MATFIDGRRGGLEREISGNHEQLLVTGMHIYGQEWWYIQTGLSKIVQRMGNGLKSMGCAKA